MFEGILSTVGAIASGGLTGLIGTTITAFSEYKTKLSAHAHEEKMTELNMQMAKLEAETKLSIAQTESDATKDVAETQAFANSHTADIARYALGDRASNSLGFIAVDVIRGLVRPTLTIYVMAIVTLIYWQLMQLVGGLTAIPTHDALAMVKTVIDGLLYIATTIVLWWFGTRSKGQK